MNLATRALLFNQSRNKCAICGTSGEFGVIQVAHITPMYEGGVNTPNNYIILCSICHQRVDSLHISPQVLTNVKQDWIDYGILGGEKIVQWVKINKNSSTASDGTKTQYNSYIQWLDFILHKKTFDTEFLQVKNEIKNLKSEGEFIDNILRPIFEFLGFEGIKVLHHSGAPEHGKDIVFYQKDNLGTLIFYAVVACNVKIHALSSKTNSSGHYQKIIDQISKCYTEPWQDNNLKVQTYIDRVIVATPGTITYDAMNYLTRWEEKERRHLIFLEKESIAGHLVRLRMGKE